MLQLVSSILIRWIVIYSLDCALQRLNNGGLVKKRKFLIRLIIVLTLFTFLLLSLIWPIMNKILNSLRTGNAKPLQFTLVICTNFADICYATLYRAVLTSGDIMSICRCVVIVISDLFEKIPQG